MESKFKGKVYAYFFFNLLTFLVILLSLGFAYPAMMAVYMRWQTKNTEINGERLCFTGKARDFYGRFLVMYALSLLTLGIYFVVKMQLELLKWELKNIHVENRMDFVSGIDIKWYQLVGSNLLFNFISSITLGIASPLALYERIMWLCRHIYVNGTSLSLGGKESTYFGKLFLWGFLSAITLGIFAIWGMGKIFGLTASYISFSDSRYVTEKTIYLKVPMPNARPEEPAVTLAPVMGETFKNVWNFLKIKRAMICFVCEIPFIIAVAGIFFAIDLWLLSLVAPIAYVLVLLSLPTIYFVEERLGSADKINLTGCTAMAICGIVLSVCVPVFMPIFIGGLVKTRKMKEYLYADYQKRELSAQGERFAEEEKKYFDDAAEYQKYIWASKTYRRDYRRYAKSVIRHDYGLVRAERLAEKTRT